MLTFRFEYSIETDDLEEAKQEVLRKIYDEYFRTSVADVFKDGEFLTVVDFEQVKEED